MTEPTNEGWKVELRDWWYKAQDEGYELPEGRRVEIEAIFKKALTEERAKAEARVRAQMIELVKENRKGTFTDDAGNDCWYVDELVATLSTEAKKETK